jgi:AraC-like DNA-binding protein
MIKSGISNPTAAALEHAEREVDRMHGELQDIFAVSETMHLLSFGGSKDALNCIEGVYMVDANKPIRRRDIEMRVTKTANEFGMSERTVYRHLKDARELFASLRGLRL